MVQYNLSVSDFEVLDGLILRNYIDYQLIMNNLEFKVLPAANCAGYTVLHLGIFNDGILIANLYENFSLEDSKLSCWRLYLDGSLKGIEFKSLYEVVNYLSTI